MRSITLVFSSLAAAALLTIAASAQQTVRSDPAERDAVKFERAKLAAAKMQVEKDAAQTRSSRAAARNQKAAAQENSAGVQQASGKSVAEAIRFEKAKLQASELEVKKQESAAFAEKTGAEKTGERHVTAVNRP